MVRWCEEDDVITDLQADERYFICLCGAKFTLAIGGVAPKEGCLKILPKKLD